MQQSRSRTHSSRNSNLAPSSHHSIHTQSHQSRSSNRSYQTQLSMTKSELCRHNERCVCQICTCGAPDHTCPRPRPKGLGQNTQSIYKKDYPWRDPKIDNSEYAESENMEFVPRPKGDYNTTYKNEYMEKALEKEEPVAWEPYQRSKAKFSSNTEYGDLTSGPKCTSFTKNRHCTGILRWTKSSVFHQVRKTQIRWPHLV